MRMNDWNLISGGTATGKTIGGRSGPTETSTIDVIGMYIRVLPLLIRISPGRFPSQDRAPVQARSPPTSSRSPPPTSHGPQSLVTDRPSRFVPPMPLSSRRGPWVLTLAGRARAACPVPSVHDLTRRVVDRPFSSPGVGSVVMLCNCGDDALAVGRLTQ